MSLTSHVPHVNLTGLKTRLQDIRTSLRPGPQQRLVERLWDELDHLSTRWSSKEREDVFTYLTDLVFDRDTQDSGRRLPDARKAVCDQRFANVSRRVHHTPRTEGTA